MAINSNSRRDTFIHATGFNITTEIRFCEPVASGSHLYVVSPSPVVFRRGWK
jgi:hypothetical protein